MRIKNQKRAKGGRILHVLADVRRGRVEKKTEKSKGM